jgi:hypothetical protein
MVQTPVNDVLYFCTACRRIHPMGVSLPLEVGFLNTKTVSEAYSSKPLPSYVAMLVGSSVTCSETGKSFVLEDINKLYLTPVLEPWCCLKRVWNRAIMVTAQFFSPFRSGTGIALSPPAERRSRCRNKSLFAPYCLSSPGFGLSGSPYRRWVGVETAAVYNEELQSTLHQTQRQKNN